MAGLPFHLTKERNKRTFRSQNPNGHISTFDKFRHAFAVLVNIPSVFLELGFINSADTNIATVFDEILINKLSKFLETIYALKNLKVIGLAPNSLIFRKFNSDPVKRGYDFIDCFLFGLFGFKLNILNCHQTKPRSFGEIRAIPSG